VSCAKQTVLLDEQQNMTLPSIRVAPYGRENLNPATTRQVNDKNDIEYPIGVAIVAAANRSQAAGNTGEDWYHWRQKILRRFNAIGGLGLSGGESIAIRVEPLDIVNQPAWLSNNLFVSSLIVWCTCREPRDTSV
jgi:hypothetical protein